ncbi:MAG TPA: flagellar filament capping protein FliD [Bryobacteraceae bacterium]|jgi:flagellar hook-associated protein 2|nr:flagellar filament capping protein FliD [Bryobacteraceae bacterium]
MATSTTSATSSSTSTFNGTSTYASQLQQTITRAVSIASLPLTQLQSTQTTLTNEQSELQTITSTFSSLQTALNSLSSSSGSGAYAATVSDSTVASATVSSGVMAGNYTVNVSSIGSQTNTISANGLTTVTDPTSDNLDSSTSYTLTLNGTNYNISDSSGTLDGLAQAINLSGANVQASVINIGSPSSPDYRLSVQSLNYAPDTIQLTDSSNNSLLNTLSTGSNVTYQVNGQPSTPISSNTRSVTLSTGLNVQLLQTGTSQVTVSQSPTNLANALSSFATAYNSINAELNKNRGQNGGALTGNSLIYQLESQLGSLANFSMSSGSIQSLSSIGLTFDQNGNLNFNQSTFTAAFAANPNDVLNFIGTSTSGGFLQTASNTLTSITDPTTGSLTTANTNFTNQLTTIASQITDEQSKISNLQDTLTQQMSAADATIASLQNQLSMMTNLFAQEQANERAAG